MVRAGIPFLVLFVSAVALADPPRPVEVVLRTGVAYCTETGKHLYTENHVQRWQGERQLSAWVSYTAPDGKVFAEKEVRYPDRHQARPSFRLEDKRSGLLHEARWRGKKIELRIRLDADEDVETAKIEAHEQLVVDAGFDHAVREHWATLVKGDKVSFRFAVPAKLDWYTVYVKKTGVVKRDGRKLVQLVMDLDSVLGWFTSEVTLLYDLEGRYLVEYKGISNLDDAEGDTQDVRIVFGPPVRKPAK